MSDRGYIRLYRSVFAHAVFRPEPFTEREAWKWLLVKAAWKPIQVRLGEHLINLDRGQVVGAVRFLAAEWGWSRGKVERYVERLKNEAMLETQTETGITVITVCNYDRYQGGDDEDETEAGRQPGQSRDAAETRPRQGRDNIKELNHSRRKEGKEVITPLFGGLVEASAASTPNADEQFRQWYAAYPKKADPKDARRLFDRVLKNKEATFEQLMEGARRYAVEMRDTPKNFIKAPAVWLNKGSWANEAGAARASAGSNRADSAIQGMLDSMTEEDFRRG